MRRHLSDETLLDLAEGRSNGPSREHLRDCPVCSERVDEAAQALAAVRGAGMPEPPEAYWTALSRGVSRKIDERSSRLPRWGWLVPLGAAAAAAAVFAFVPWSSSPPVASPVAAVQSWSALPPIEEDAAAPILEAAASDAEPGLAAIDEGRGLGSFVAALTDDEARALADALREQRKEGSL